MFYLQLIFWILWFTDVPIVLNAFPPALRGMCMYWVNFIINILVTSGSGQAAVVMPIFTPVADMVGITRQTAILAFNFGDGFCNLHSSYVYRINGELKCCKYSLRSLDALYVENHASLVGSRKCPGIYRSNDSLRPHVTANISKTFNIHYTLVISKKRQRAFFTL